MADFPHAVSHLPALPHGKSLTSSIETFSALMSLTRGHLFEGPDHGTLATGMLGSLELSPSRPTFGVTQYCW